MIIRPFLGFELDDIFIEMNPSIFGYLAFDPRNKSILKLCVCNFPASSNFPLARFLPASDVVDRHPEDFGDSSDGHQFSLLDKETLYFLVQDFILGPFLHRFTPG